MAIYLIFVIWPYVQAIGLSMTDWSGLTPTQDFTGFANYIRLAHDPVFWLSLWHNVILLIVLPLITLTLGLFFAFMINVGGRKRKNQTVAGVRGSKLYQVVYFFPQVLSITVIAVLWGAIYNPNNGALNSGLRAIGIPSTISWLSDPKLALGCVIAVMVWWQVGFYVVLFSAGMSAIPDEIYEAVLLDGANRFTTFFKITFPLIWDTIQTGWVYLGIIAMDGFAIVQIMTNGPGGPDGATTVVPFYLWDSAFNHGQAGYGISMGVAMLIVTLLFAVLTLRFSRRERIEF
ncbi:carbohydrate ABC transporter permease [Fodinicola feengrottensis]|uniref:carbohydrate ABC transporter permease n=1 Tax=Fodinicola feengrottensis TaxID=435914 RepID=UPI002441D4D0|nr:sugar ABC transporter permease [Fodinicola feengrottensis]